MGANFQDSKDARRAFNKHDENKGGLMLFDEFIYFADEHNLNIEKHYIV